MNDHRPDEELLKDEGEPKTKPHVLVVDDVEINRRLVAAVIGDSVSGLDQAGDGQEALEMIEAGNKYDLIVLDYEMPRMNGLEFLRRIKGIQDKPKVILSTSHELNEQEMETFKNEGADYFLPKPYKIADLSAIIKEVGEQKVPGQPK